MKESTKILTVGGLSLNTSEKELREAFGKFGPLLDVTIKADPVTGRSNRSGHVTFSDAADACRAMAAMKSRLCWQVGLAN